MEKRSTFLFFAVLLCMVGMNLKAVAQDVPAPKGKWTFENASNLLEASAGALQLQPVIVGTKTATLCETPDQAGIAASDGPTAANKASGVPKTGGLGVALNAQSETNNYTIQMDFMVEDATPYNGLFQTAIMNDNDADMFVYNHTIGIGTLGYGGAIVNKRWYRMMLVNNNGTFSLYVDGELINSNGNNESRFVLEPEGFYLCCDEDGEAANRYVSEIAYWDAPFTEEQIKAYGNFEQEGGSTLEKDENGFYKIATAEQLVEFSDLVNAGELTANAVLTADLDMGGKLVDGAPAEDSPLFTPIGSTSAPYKGIFDGQDHIIKNLVINTSYDYTGLFGRITGNAVIKNFIVDSNSYIGGNAFVGVVGGTINGSSTVLIDRIGMEGAVVAGAQNAGGVLGCNMDNPPTVLSNCYVTGPVKGARESGQINGWLGGGRIENCWAIGTIEGVYNGDAFYRGAPVAINNYSNAPDRNDGVNEFNEEDARSGLMTYMLNNANTDNPAWFQTIGEDALPTLNASHKIVYPNGHISCGGEPIGDVTYSNDPNGMQKDEHDVVAGVCSTCGYVDVNYSQKDAEGYFLIDNAEELVWFAYMANSGIKGLAGRLTSDINMSSVNDIFPMIGNNDCLFNS
ncbi:MAG: hypothetical protein J6X23_01585, partial [Bacteroidaceae bacterium]|nr:hypothetical protein [Bacteroidaceae bacterium]